MPIYVRTLLTAFPARETLRQSPTHPYTRSALHPVEPLTDREIQILRLMAARLSHREMAEELFLSINTIKWYAGSIYSKLGVSRKVEAAELARELSLI